MSKLMRMLPVMLAAFIVMTLAGCGDPEPGEISMQIFNNGQQWAAVVQVFNAAGKQVQETNSDQFGVCYVKGLAPGKYTLKFKGNDGTMFPAVRDAEVTPGGSVVLKVELTQATDAGAPAS